MKHHAKHIEGLPFSTINALLSLTLQHGTVHVSERAIRHIRTRHPVDCDLCLASIEIVVAAPEFIGQEPHHHENFEVIRHVNGLWVLVAISSVPDEYGDYPIMSCYTIPEGAFQRRFRKGHIQRYS